VGLENTSDPIQIREQAVGSEEDEAKIRRGGRSRELTVQTSNPCERGGQGADETRCMIVSGPTIAGGAYCLSSSSCMIRKR